MIKYGFICRLLREEHRQQLINQHPNERTPSEQDFAYLGGFIDAECCFKISSYNDNRRLNPNLNYKIILECNNSKLPVFPWLLRKFGGNIYFTLKNKKHKKNRNQLTWRISCKALSKILPKVYPFLKYKQPVCKKLLDFYKTTLPIGGDRQSNKFKQFNDPKYSLKYSYDIKGNLVLETDPIGRKAEYEYDENNNKTFEKDFSGKKTFFFYDYCNRLIKQEVIDGDKKYTNEYEYDMKHNKTLEKNIRGGVTKYEHDALGNVIKEEFSSNVETTFGERKLLTQSYKYDAFSRQTEKTDPLGYTTTTAYNIFDKPTLIIHPDETKEENIYNLDGTLNTHINQEGTQTKYAYDYKQRVTSKKIYSPKNALLQEESFEHNAVDLISKTDAEGNITKYTYDGAGRKIKEDFFYDSLGFVAKKIKGEALIIIYIRDDIGRVKEKLIQNIYGTLLSQIKYEYDDQDNKKQITSYVTIVEEKDGKKVKESKEAIENRSHDIFGRLIKTIDPNGKETIINYDDFYKNAHGETAKQKVLENAVHQQIITTYDILDREKTVEHVNPQGKTVAFEEKFYDLNGNLTRQVSSIHDDSERDPREVTTFWKYDLNRLILLTEAYGTKDEKTTGYTYKNSKIHTIIKPDQTILKYSYDSLGNNTKLKSINTVRDSKDENLKNKSIHYKFTYNKCNYSAMISIENQKKNILYIFFLS